MPVRAAWLVLIVVLASLVPGADAQGASRCPRPLSADAPHGEAKAHAKARRAATRSRRTRRLRRAARCRAAARPRSRAVPPRPFAPTSFWNTPLPRDAKLDPLSSTYAAELRRQVRQYGPYINTTRFSTPVYTVPAGQPTVRVALDQFYPRLQAALEEVPIPPGAVPAPGTDANIVIWQPSTDTMWELYRAAERSDGWHAFYGGRMDGVSKNPGHFTDPPLWGATATSIPLLGGLIRLDELDAGKIDHGLAIAIPEVRADAFSYPAMRTDGRATSPTAIPQGARFRIDPDVDLDRIPMAPVVRRMAEAAQRYGMVVRDGARAVVFYAEDPAPTGRNPYAGPNGHFEGEYVSNLLAQFPWQHIQVTQTWMFSRR